MPSVFTPPIVLHNPPVLPDTRGVARRLFRYLGPQPVGVSIVGPYPTYTTVETPDQLTLAGMTQGVDYFLGGHVYEVSDAVAAALAAAGYEVVTGITSALLLESGDSLLTESGDTLILEA